MPFDGKIKDVEITASWKYLGKFWGTLEMLLINCEKNLILTWSVHLLIMDSTDERELSITNTNPHYPKGTLSTQDNAKLLKQLESGFKQTINWSNYQSTPETQSKRQYLIYFIDYLNNKF